MRTFNTEAIIIKRRNYGEADRLLTVFSKNHGKLIVKAKGIRRVPSRRSAHVELLNQTVLTLHQGKRYYLLTEATALETFPDLKKDLQKIGFAYHICELIDGLCAENQEQRNVYFLLLYTLKQLSFCNSDDFSLRENSEYGKQGASVVPDEIIAVIHDFEVKLLTLLGYWHRTMTKSTNFDTHSFIENILERKLRSKRVFVKLNVR